MARKNPTPPAKVPAHSASDARADLAARAAHNADGGIERHFVILSFAARWLAGEPRLNAELAEARWLRPSELTGLPTTEGLADIVAAAFDRLEPAG